MPALSRNIALALAFDGSDFHGWQKQPNVKTVEGVLFDAVTGVMKDVTDIFGVSRTDAGVSAYSYACNFFTDNSIPTENIPRALNSLLPPTIRVFDAAEVPESFNSRFSVKKKTYKYKILNAFYNTPFAYNHNWHITKKLDIKAMKKQAKYLVGEHNFSAFCSAQEERDNKVRKIHKIDIRKFEENVEITITADGFLYNMVRIIVGTLVEIGLGKELNIKEILETRDRTKAGQTAPASGLFLYAAEY